MPAKRTEPTRRATDMAAGFKYTNAVSTDIGKRFAAIRRAEAKTARAQQPAAAHPRQGQLDLDGGAQVLPLFKQASAA